MLNSCKVLFSKILTFEKKYFLNFGKVSDASSFLIFKFGNQFQKSGSVLSIMVKSWELLQQGKVTAVFMLPEFCRNIVFQVAEVFFIIRLEDFIAKGYFIPEFCIKILVGRHFKISIYSKVGDF